MLFDLSVSLETHVVLLPFLDALFVYVPCHRPLGLLFSKGGHGVCNVRNDVDARCAHKGETAPKRDGEGGGRGRGEGQTKERVCA